MNHKVTIPEHEIEITASRSGGAGGQHVNKTSSRITARWNIKNSSILNDEQKQRVLEKLQSRLTSEGDLIVHNSTSRSQQHNKKMALAQLQQELNKALHVAKKRVPTKLSKAMKETRLQTKARKGALKKLRRRKFDEE